LHHVVRKAALGHQFAAFHKDYDLALIHQVVNALLQFWSHINLGDSYLVLC
jgi:hypothetical protein